MDKEKQRYTINDLLIDDYMRDIKHAIDGNDWYEIEGKYLRPFYEQIIILQQENERLKVELLEKKCSDKDIEYKKRLKIQNNWNTLKEYLNQREKESSGLDTLIEFNLAFNQVILKMQELEGSDDGEC